MGSHRHPHVLLLTECPRLETVKFSHGGFRVCLSGLQHVMALNIPQGLTSVLGEDSQAWNVSPTGSSLCVGEASLGSRGSALVPTTKVLTWVISLGNLGLASVSPAMKAPFPSRSQED